MQALRILHLEDDTMDADLVHREVERLGVTPTWLPATCADEFVGAMEGGRFDAILSDSCVPGIDGLQALQLALDRRPGVPFVFVSGNADPRWAERCLAAGATDYVAKDQLWRLPSALRRLHDAREGSRLARLTQGRAVLVDAVKRLSMARDTDTIVDIVRRAARALHRADGASFVLRDGDLCHYVDEDAIGPLWKGQRFPMSACISGWAMLHRQPAVVPDIEADPRIPVEAYRPTFVKSLVMVPIRAEAPIGAIGTYWAGPHEADEDEVELIQALADSTALAFENVRLVQSLEDRVRRRTDELQQANRELEAFSYSVSHDLRAPLRAVQGYAELLAHEPAVEPGTQAAAFVQNIRDAGVRMNHLIDDMLTLAKVTRADLRRTRVPIGKLALSVLQALQASAPDRRVRLQVDTTLTVQADAGLLRLALENLLSNAWKFTARCADAAIEFGATTDDDGRTVFHVRDNGAGFDMAHAGQLFEPFRRLHREVDFPGTGVGLAIVRRVIHRHGGEVWAQAARGEGASFYFVLPAPDA